jgi:hypothetical protein
LAGPDFFPAPSGGSVGSRRATAHGTDAAGLQVGEGDHGEERVMMEPEPTAPLEVIEVIEPQFFLQLLMHLLAHRAAAT